MRFSRFLAVLATLLLASVSVFAQGSTTGALTGVITSDGTPLPGATVTVRSPQLQGVRTAVSDSNGNYSVSALPPGDYTVHVELQGLQPVTRSARVSLAGTARVDVDLRVSAVTEAITVTATAPATLETTEVQTSIQADLIEDLPIPRTLLGTVNLAPGVTTNGPGGNTMISGGPSYDSTFIVDGAVVNELLRGQPQNLFIEDALQETTVQTGGVSAEFGRFTGGVVTAISKSGGNEFDGSLRDSLTNPSWTSDGELSTADPTDELLHTYEGTLGGRIIRDRLWFFTAARLFELDYQRRLARTPTDTEDITYQYGDEETRLELKLTGQLTPKHSLSGSYFDIQRDQTNNPFGAPLEISALDAGRSLPNSFYTVNYNGIITNNFLIEALYARQNFEFVDSGADEQAPLERGTNIYYYFPNQYAGYPTFCSGCAPFPESRNNYNAKLKGSYFLSTPSIGSHTITGGYEDYEDMLKSDNYQSASSFTIWSFDTPRRAPDGTLLHVMGPGAGYLIWFPILESSQGNAFNTKSLFLNDRWDLNQNFSFNLGVRYDKNHAENQQGTTVADDSKFSPRLGATYDVFGNGRLRVNATYSQYASKIANGNVGDASSGAGSPSYLYWLYYGEALDGLPTDQFLDAVGDWFESIGGAEDTAFLLGGGTAGLSTQIRDGLKSPGMDEYTIGVGTQIGTNGFIRADYQHREWNDFYTNFANTSIGKIYDPLVGAEGANVDLTLVGNSDDFTREYDAFIVQGAYRLFNRINLGANYTWSELVGNVVGETAGGGPGATGGSEYYPEFYNYARNNPVGPLGADQTHKLRAWASYDLPTPVGNFNFSVLQRFDSGTPYSAFGNIWVAQGAFCAQCPSDAETQYFNISQFSQGTYYFSERGEFKTDDIQATDLAVNYSLPIGGVQLFAQGELINAFNRQGVVNVNTTVRTATSGACVQTVGDNAGDPCAAFNPFTETPIEGVHWQKGPSFGEPITPTSVSRSAAREISSCRVPIASRSVSVSNVRRFMQSSPGLAAGAFFCPKFPFRRGVGSNRTCPGRFDQRRPPRSWPRASWPPSWPRSQRFSPAAVPANPRRCRRFLTHPSS